MTRWLRAGPKVTIWIAVLAAGLLVLGAGLGQILAGLARRAYGRHGTFHDFLTYLGKPGQASIAILIGLALMGVAVWQLRRSSLALTLSIVESHAPGQMLVTRQSGGLPSGVLLSGHMGLLVSLNAVRDMVGRVTAVTPPGSDFRSIARLLRPSHPDAHITSATAENAELCARLSDGRVITGATNLEQVLGSPIEDLYLSTGGPAAAATWPVGTGVDRAIQTSDVVIIGPGSFYTSIVPFFLVPDLRDCLRQNARLTVYICNIMTEPGRTDGWTVSDFIRRFTEYAGFAPRFTVVNRSYPGSNILSRYEVTGSYPVMVTPEEQLDASKVVLGSRFPGSTTLYIGGSTVIEADIIEVINENRLTIDPEQGGASEQVVSVIRHDSEKLARVLRNIVGSSRLSAVAG